MITAVVANCGADHIDESMCFQSGGGNKKERERDNKSGTRESSPPPPLKKRVEQNANKKQAHSPVGHMYIKPRKREGK